MVTLTDAQVQTTLQINIADMHEGECGISTTGDVYTLTTKATNANVFSVLSYPKTNIFYVAKSGSDTNTGIGNPYLTVNAAIQAAIEFGQPCTIMINPGNYEEVPLTLPANVDLVGSSATNTTISAVATSSMSLITVNGARCAIRDLKLDLSTTTDGLTLKIIDITSGNDTFAMNNCHVDLDALTVSSGTHYCLYNSGTGVTSYDPLINTCDFDCKSNGNGTYGAVYIGTGTMNFSTCSITCTRTTSGTGTFTAFQTGTSATANCKLLNCLLNGYTNDIIQGSNSSIYLNRATVLLNSTYTGNNLSVYNTQDWQFGEPSTLPSSGYMYRGTAAASTAEIIYYISRPTLVFGMYVNARQISVSSGTGEGTFTVRKKVGATLTSTALTCTLSTTSTTPIPLFASNTTNVVSFAAGDYLLLQFNKTGNNTIINDTVVQISIF